jgi:hypothetical protein
MIVLLAHRVGREEWLLTFAIDHPPFRILW